MRVATVVTQSTNRGNEGPDQTQLQPPSQNLAFHGTICQKRRAMAQPKGKEFCPSTLSQYLHLESSLAMQIQSLAHNTFPQRTLVS